MSEEKKTKDQMLTELGDYMVNSTNNLQSTLEEHFPDLTEEEATEYLDGMNIMECHHCGWWCDDWAETDDDADLKCTDCAE